MLKTHGHRRLALLLALVFVTSLLAACSSSQSSTDEPLSHPGKDYIGTIRMDIDPTNEKIEITKVYDAVSNTQLTKGNGFSVSTSGQSFAGDTLTGNISFKWTGPERLEQASIRVFGADSTGLNAKIDNSDNCVGPLATVGNCIGSGGQGIVYTGDTISDGAETEFECLGTMPSCNPSASRALRLQPPGCTAGTVAGNSITAQWKMTETTSGHPKYTFNAHVYGKRVPPLAKDDPRYDVDVATYNLKAYAPISTGNFPMPNFTRPLTYVRTGQWFYIMSYVDAPGDKSRGQTSKMCDDGNGNTVCSMDPAFADHYDFYYVEDQANFNALSTGNLWQSLSSFNTGFLYCSQAWWQMQWDPAVLKCNDNSQGVGTTLGSGVKSFKTKGAVGTVMYSFNDTVGTDQWIDNTTIPSGWANRCLTSYLGNYAYPTTYPPLPDGLDVDDYGTGSTQGDFPSGYISMKAIGPSGSAAAVRLSPSGNTIYLAGIGQKASGPNFALDLVTQKSPNYPMWANAVGVGEGPGESIGHYNETIAWVCIQ